MLYLGNFKKIKYYTNNPEISNWPKPDRSDRLKANISDLVPITRPISKHLLITIRLIDYLMTKGFVDLVITVYLSSPPVAHLSDAPRRR